jgi:hypothetical protein
MRKGEDAAVLVQRDDRCKTLAELQAAAWHLYDEITERNRATRAAARLLKSKTSRHRR